MKKKLNMDEFRIDSHKLIYHVASVYHWLQGEDIYPIYAEISPSGACNHRCLFCALDYLDYKPQYIKMIFLKEALTEMAKGGLKSVMYAGEGEPLLHKDIVELVRYTRSVGIDVAMTTNGALLNERIIPNLLEPLTWIRISLDAATPKTYAKIHRCNSKDFSSVIDNIKNTVRIKKENNYNCAIGTQLLLLKENYNEAETLAKLLKNVGVDYLIIKPYSQHPKSRNRAINIGYRRCVDLKDRLQKLSDNNFKVIFRIQTMQKIKVDKTYKHCLGLPFWTYIDANGDVYACSTFLGDKRFCYGNIYKDDFREIWIGEKRKLILNLFTKKIDIGQCRKACRLDEINKYLWELKNPPPHVNFI